MISTISFFKCLIRESDMGQCQTLLISHLFKDNYS